MDPTICTAGGRLISLLHSHPGDVDIQDIAHALSNTCRFGGHTREFYSVAQHSVLVCQQFLAVSPHSRIDRMSDAQRRAMARVALLHDAAEAYLGDVVSPLKERLHGYKPIEQQMLARIFAEFGLDEGDAFDMPRPVKQADELLLQWERRDLIEDMPEWPVDLLEGLPAIRPMVPKVAKAAFLEHFQAVFR